MPIDKARRKDGLEDLRGSDLASVKERWSSIDLLRGLAALIVFLFHYHGLATWGRKVEWGAAWLEPVMQFAGSLGTNILMLLSGFFIATSLQSARFSYKKFLRSKTERLYRPYLFVLGASLLFWALVPSAAKEHPGQSDLDYILHNLILIPEIFPSRPVLTVTWTLSYIYTGYCLLPLLALAQRRWAPRLSQAMLWVLVVATVFGCYVLMERPMPRIAYIPAGCLLATWIADRSRLQLNRMQVGLLLLLTALLLTLRFQLHTNQTLLAELGRARSVVFVTLGVLSMMLLTWASITTEHKRHDLFQQAAPRMLAMIGKRGYSIYLWHGPVSKILIAVCNILLPMVMPQAWGYAVMMVVCLVGTLAVAEYSFRYIESIA